MSERLKGIKSNARYHKLSKGDGLIVYKDMIIAKEDYDYLIEQAERFEAYIKETSKIYRQNKRYRLILSYVKEIDCIDWNKKELAEMARQALEESE